MQWHAELSTQRLSAKTNLKLAKLWLDRKEYSRLQKVALEWTSWIGIGASYLFFGQILQELYRSTIGENGEDQAQKGTQLLEIYALEIQMHNERKNYKKLKVASLPYLFQCHWSSAEMVGVPTGDLQRIQRRAIRDPTSAHHGCDQGVRR